MPKIPKVFIGVPAKGPMLPECFLSVMNSSTDPNFNPVVQFGKGGVDVAHECNGLWSLALNRKIDKFDFLCLHHSDVQAENGWLDILLQEQKKTKADIVSVCLAIKDARGVSSTAVCGYKTPSRRLTLKQAHAVFSEHKGTFDIKEVEPESDGFLGINTGLVLFRFDEAEAWTRQGFCFHIDNRIEERDDGSFVPIVMPEDWNIGEFAASRDLKVMVTTKVKAKHFEQYWPFDNSPWGQEEDTGESFPT